MPKSLAEHIRELENTLAAREKRREEVAQKSIEEGRSLDESEKEELAELKAEIKQLAEDLVEYRDIEKSLRLSARPVDEPRAAVDKAVSKGPMIITQKSDREDDFKGQAFVRKTIAMIMAKAYSMSPGEVAEQFWGKTHPRLVEVIKASRLPMVNRAAVPGIAGGSGEPGSELVSYDNRYTQDFIEFLYAETAYNKLPLRTAPANVTIKGQDGAATANWVGESKGIPMSRPDFMTVQLGYKKVAALTTASLEWMMHADPGGEMILRDALVAATAQAIDARFFSATAGTANVSPNGILYNVNATTSAGTDGDAVLNDIKELRERFIAQNNASGLYWAMSRGLASSLSLMRNALGQREFTEINQNGGTLEGDPVVTGDNINRSHLILLKPSDIYKIGSGAIRVAMSQDATIEQDTAPTAAQDTPTAQSANAVNMFETDSVALKVVVDIDFQKRRAHAAQYINDADYGGSIST